MKYPLDETFFSVQGEGCHAGRRAYFARFFGCNVKCPWCDTRASWNGKPAMSMSAEEIGAEAGETHAEIAVITGGEPCLHDLSPLLKRLADAGIAAHLETSGTLEIRESDEAKFAWVALSPKLFAAPLESSLRRADELKFIVSDLCELDAYAPFADAATNAQAVWLHPEWTRRADQNLLDGLCDFVKSRGGKYRVGWQLHKCYFAR